MLTDLIIRYLESNKRLVVPQLGAFVAKAPGGPVLFTELMRRDDGVLRGLLCAGGMSELEAAGAVDRFVFEVRHAVQEGREFRMEGLGTLRGGPEGTIVFLGEAQPAARSRTGADEGSASGVSNAEPASGTVHAAGVVSAADSSREDEAGKTTASGAISETVSGAISETASGAGRAAEGGRAAGASAKAPVSASASGETERRPADAARAPRRPAAEVSVPSKLHPDPSVKGLRYGKPVKTTNAYAFVGSAPRRRVDKLILVAIAAAVVALAAIAYGYIRDWQNEREGEFLIEETLPPVAPNVGAEPAAADGPAAAETSGTADVRG